jgi:hypothetical protein
MERAPFSKTANDFSARKNTSFPGHAVFLLPPIWTDFFDPNFPTTFDRERVTFYGANPSLRKSMTTNITIDRAASEIRRSKPARYLTVCCHKRGHIAVSISRRQTGRSYADGHSGRAT